MEEREFKDLKGTDQSFRVMSLNCQRGYREKELIPFLRDILSHYKVLLLQELDQKTYKELLKLDTHAIYSLTTLEQGGIALLLSKEYSPDEVVRVPVLNQKYHFGTYTFGMIGVVLDDCFYGSVHLPAHLAWKKRRKSIEKIMSILKETGKEKICIGGDWNCILPFEYKGFQKIVNPYSLIRCKKPSYILRNIERGAFLNNVAWTASRVFSPRFNLDCFLLNNLEYSPITALPNEVSDHLALTFFIHE